MKIGQFEDLLVWQRARALAQSVYTMTRKSPFAKDFGFKDQIQRAAVSVSSNIAEGFERNSSKEFVNFLFIAKGSCGEVRSQIRLACDLGYVAEAEAKEVIDVCCELGRQLFSFAKSLQSSPIAGTRYMPSKL